MLVGGDDECGTYSELLISQGELASTGILLRQNHSRQAYRPAQSGRSDVQSIVQPF